MTTLEAFERLLDAMQEMTHILREQARIIAEYHALDAESARLLDSKRAHAISLVAQVSEDLYE